jgi:hypothetical protein
MVNHARLTFALLGTFALAQSAPPAFADEDRFLGTWVLNAAKSNGPPGTVPESSTVVVSEAGSGTYKSVSDSVIAGGAVHTEVTYAADGKDYTPVTTPARPGAPAVTQSFERIDATTYKISVKVNGQVVVTVLEEVSTDGRTMTITTTGTGRLAGVSNVTVFDKK